MNTNQFTQKTMEALQNAQSLAIEHQNQALEPEHLLAALASQENGFIPQLLKRMGVEPSAFAVAAQEKVEQLPPQIVNGKPVPQGTVNNYQFISEDSQWKVSLTKGFVALSTHGYLRWEEFAKRLDRVLAALIQLYQPAYFTRVGLRYINAIDRAALPPLANYWAPGVTVSGLHELVANALVMKGEQPRTMNLRQEDLECPDPEPEEEAVEELAASAEEDN